MPELPEVETLRIGLTNYLVGHKIMDVEILHPKVFYGDEKSIIGAKVTDIKRVGKGLIIELNNDYSLAIHIKLTGQLIYRDPKTAGVEVSKVRVGTLPNNFTHLIFHLNKNAKLYYNDQRRFGWVKVIRKDEVMKLPFFKDMGPEPPVAKAMGGRAIFNLEKFEEILSKSKTVIKPLLMDQKKIGGIGNIYANDGLFLARIDPRRKANSLSPTQIKKLYESLLTVLKKGLDSGGASELTFVNVLGQDGGYQKHSLAYGKKGKDCPNCGEKIQFIKISGRGTYFCKNCQK